MMDVPGMPVFVVKNQVPPMRGRKEEKMTKKEKITIKGGWVIAPNRMEIVGATYRQALTYLVALRMRYGRRNFLQKPELIYI